MELSNLISSSFRHLTETQRSQDLQRKAAFRGTRWSRGAAAGLEEQGKEAGRNPRRFFWLWHVEAKVKVKHLMGIFRVVV